ncbi:hypothetical protein B0H14DRAFT_2558756 [Mycena olivaceomarginata]|nr:hypothetical protein B0H14DRAFT_2558756 [Mycena olivaceomarginata]
MSTALTFVAEELLNTTIVAPDGGVHYTTTTTDGWLGRKVTTVSAASGLVGFIDWREKVFVINGVQRKWDELKSRPKGILSSEREWTWGSRPYRLKYNLSQKELLATPTVGSTADTVRFTPYRPHLLHANERAAIYLPHQMQDEIERMFLLMVVLQTEMKRQDERK